MCPATISAVTQVVFPHYHCWPVRAGSCMCLSGNMYNMYNSNGAAGTGDVMSFEIASGAGVCEYHDLDNVCAGFNAEIRFGLG